MVSSDPHDRIGPAPSILDQAATPIRHITVILARGNFPGTEKHADAQRENPDEHLAGQPDKPVIHRFPIPHMRTQGKQILTHPNTTSNPLAARAGPLRTARSHASS